MHELDWKNIPMKPKYVNKTHMVEHRKFVTEFIDEIITEKQFDEQMQKHILRQVKTGKKIEVIVKEILPMYDINNNYIGDDFIDKYDIEMRMENVLDEKGNEILEKEIDDNGEEVKIPVFEVKYTEQNTRALLLPCFRFQQWVA